MGVPLLSVEQLCVDYEDPTVLEFLELFASAYGLSASRRPASVELVAQVKLEDRPHVEAGGLARGMKQRLFLAKTLLHDPKRLLLDEPARFRLFAQGRVLAFLLWAVARKLHKGRAPSLSRRGGLGCYTWILFLSVAGAWRWLTGSGTQSI